MRPSFLDKVSNSNIDERSGEIRARVERWLFEMGFAVEEHQEEGLAFFFAAKDQGHTLGIAQPADEPDLVEIMSALNISAYSRLFTNHKNATRSPLLWELTFALLDTGLAFDREGNPIKNIHLRSRIYHDGLTKDRFAQEILKVQLATRRIFGILDREMKKSPIWKATYIS